MSQIDPGHSYAKTTHISFQFFQQQNSPATFSYEYYVSLPPSYNSNLSERYPLLLFLHGAGESQIGLHQSYASLRHGIPKVILCYDRLKDGKDPHIEIPSPHYARAKSWQVADIPRDQSSDPVPREVCEFVAERFITVSPSLSTKRNGGYGWNAAVLEALVDEVSANYRVDKSRVNVTGFSMGGYGTWKLGLKDPDRFASLVPICGGGDESLAKNLKHVPQWYVPRAFRT
jgi:predicted peptidase